MAKKSYGASGRFGNRYGKSTRDKIGKAEELVKKSTKCPSCNKDKVKRVSAGIWECEKCGTKFTGKAYYFDRKSMISSKTAKIEHVDLQSDEDLIKEVPVEEHVEEEHTEESEEKEE